MLAELRVRGLAVIADARLELGPGLNVLSGETGAGKSLLVDALALLLGERADAALVRPGSDRAVVEGVFEGACAGDGMREELDRHGIECEDDRLVLKREVHSGGRSRAWINGGPATVGTLASVGALLVDLHGQHEAQSLLKPDVQRAILDSWCSSQALAADVASSRDRCDRLAAERDALEARHAETRRRADYLRHVADEIAAAAPRLGELESLESEARRLGHAEEIGRTAAELGELLDGEDGSCTAALGHAGRLLAGLERIDAVGSAGWREMLDAALLNSGELARAVREYADALDLDPARLAAAERRRDLLHRLDQKYGPGMDRVVAAGVEAARELDLLDTAGADLAALGAELAAAEREFAERCRQLTAARHKGARRLASSVSAHLATLGMQGGSFSVAFDPLERPGRHGAERIDFQGALNPGLPARSIARAASGGELSRLMLALKVELASHDRIGSLVFDEVDAGIGGQVAQCVADALRRVAAGRQVLVITHLPLIAAAADRHLVVTKHASGGTTITEVREVENSDRVEELARMLGGAGSIARRHARELLQKLPT